MSSFEKGGQVTQVAEKDPPKWPTIKTTNVFRDPYPGWGADRVCRGLPGEWFDVDFDPAERSPEDFLADLETGERVCLDCPLAVECRTQAQACRARGLFGAVVTTESGTSWPVDLWYRMKTGGRAKKPEAPPDLRDCALDSCDRKFTFSRKKPQQKYCNPECSTQAKRVAWRESKQRVGQRVRPEALAS